MNKQTIITRWIVRGCRVLPVLFLFLIAGTEGAGWGLAGFGAVMALAGIAFNQFLPKPDRITW